CIEIRFRNNETVNLLLRRADILCELNRTDPLLHHVTLERSHCYVNLLRWEPVNKIGCSSFGCFKLCLVSGFVKHASADVEQQHRVSRSNFVSCPFDIKWLILRTVFDNCYGFFQIGWQWNLHRTALIVHDVELHPKVWGSTSWVFDQPHF